MPLSDCALRCALATRELVITPFPEDRRIQPASIDLRLGPELLVLRPEGYSQSIAFYPDVDLRGSQDVRDNYEVMPTEGFVLEPDDFVLGATAESVELGNTLCAHFDGRSTLGRLGIIVHVTAGFIDPGFKGNITLEIKNVSRQRIILAAGIGIGQLIVHRMDGEVLRPYGSSEVGSKYGGVQHGAVPPNLGRKL